MAKYTLANHHAIPNAIPNYGLVCVVCLFRGGSNCDALPVELVTVKHMRTCPKCGDAYEGKTGYCIPCRRAYGLANYAWMRLVGLPIKRQRPTGERALQMVRDWRRRNGRTYTQNPEVKRRNSARQAANSAKRKGLLIPQPCKCGRLDVEMHHEDYSKPLDVLWVCPACHGSLVRKRVPKQSN